MGNCINSRNMSSKEIKLESNWVINKDKTSNSNKNIKINNEKLDSKNNINSLNDINDKKRKYREKFDVVLDKQESEIYENFKKESKNIEPNEILTILKFLKSHFLFHYLSSDELKDLIIKMFYCTVNKNEYVFKQNDNASSFFIINSGVASVEIDGIEKKKLQLGDGFGELALLYNAPRSASIKACENLGLWTIQRHTFKKFVEEMTIKNSKENRDFLQKVTFFDSMTEEQKGKIADSLILQKFDKNQIIVNKGDQASSYYIIKSGEVSCLDGDKEIRVLKEGDTFGEKALFESNKRSLTVSAKTEAKCLAIGRDTLQSILGAKVQEVIEKNWQKWAIEKDTLLNQLTKIQIEKLLRESKVVDFNEDKILESTTLNNIYIVLNGKLSFNGKNYEKLTVFGSEILEENNNLKLNGDVEVYKDSKLAIIPIKVFLNLIGGNIKEVIKKNKEKVLKLEKINKAEELNKESRLKEVSNLDELIFLKKLGEGQFGHVYLVRKNELNKEYALKAISKKQVIDQCIEKHVVLEKDVLTLINHPLLIKLYSTYKDDNFVYFLTEFYRGMELFDVIRQLDLLDNDQSRFYTGSIILGLEYLHKNNIIYRDLKPENIMVDSNGKMIIIDMGISKILGNKNKLKKTFTLVGTPHYIAPEILQGKGYSYNIDLWSVGICLFEFMCGFVPFGEDCEDPFEIYEFISKNDIAYPSYFNVKENKNAKNLIEQLLNKVPDARLGRSYDSLKAHSWFDDFDWDKLYSHDLEPPYKPDTNFVMDKRSFNEMIEKKIPIKNELDKLDKTFKISKKNKKSKNLPNWDEDF